MIDIHSHILPSVDDGAESWEVARKMCEIAVSDGITHMVATPHANSRFPYNRHDHAERLAELQRLYQNKLAFSLGCDFHLSFENLEILFANPGEFLIGGTRYLLIEFNDFGLPPRFDQLLFRMKTELRIVPILTHPERYPILQRKPQQVVPWVESGCLIQITANSLTGHWGRGPKEAAIWLLQKKLVHVIASDAHDTARRPPVLSEARCIVSGKIGSDAALALVETNPGIIVKDGPPGSLFWAQ